MKIDILAFGVHPDDVELSCAGTLISEKRNGKKIGIIDLTKGELGTRGNAESREREAEEAARIMGADVRENLSMEDGFFENEKANQMKIIRVLRKYQPEIILCNAPEDRHPDHGRSAQLVSDAVFLSGLRKIITYVNEVKDTIEQQAWRPKYLFNYIQDRFIQPNFVVDITDVFEKKLEAIKAFKTQFFIEEKQHDDEPQTYISTPEFLDSVIYRSKMFGKMIGVKYAEGYISQKMIGIQSFDALIKENT